MIQKHFVGVLVVVLGLWFPAGAWAVGMSAYVCAHPDDCVLFMNPNLYNDIAHDADKTVMLYLTSGDGGEAFSTSDASYPYVREQASLGMTGWMGAIGHDAALPLLKKETVQLHGHAIERVRYANTVSYFLRLPDGNMYGEGFARYGHQSLQKLQSGEIASMTGIDGKTRYSGWQDLVATLAAIMAKEAGADNNITLHLADTNISANRDDHSDHQHGAQAMMQALEIRIQGDKAHEQCYRLYHHLDYVIATLPPNLDTASLKDKVASFAALTAIQQRLLGFHHWNAAHERYLLQNYYTVTSFPAGCGDAR